MRWRRPLEIDGNLSKRHHLRACDAASYRTNQHAFVSGLGEPTGVSGIDRQRRTEKFDVIAGCHKKHQGISSFFHDTAQFIQVFSATFGDRIGK